MSYNDDSMILNIQMPVKRAPAVAKPSRREEFQQRRDNKSNRFENRGNQGSNFRQGGTQNRHRGPLTREDMTDENGYNTGNLQRNSKKISKQDNWKKRNVTKQFDEDANIQELLEVDEKKDEEAFVFSANTFAEVDGLSPKLVATLKEANLLNLTKIQKESFPVIMRKKNCIIKSETGSGKTLAYLV